MLQTWLSIHLLNISTYIHPSINQLTIKKSWMICHLSIHFHLLLNSPCPTTDLLPSSCLSSDYSNTFPISGLSTHDSALPILISLLTWLTSSCPWRFAEMPFCLLEDFPNHPMKLGSLIIFFHRSLKCFFSVLQNSLCLRVSPNDLEKYFSSRRWIAKRHLLCVNK